MWAAFLCHISLKMEYLWLLEWQNKGLEETTLGSGILSEFFCLPFLSFYRQNDSFRKWSLTVILPYEHPPATVMWLLLLPVLHIRCTGIKCTSYSADCCFCFMCVRICGMNVSKLQLGGEHAEVEGSVMCQVYTHSCSSYLELSANISAQSKAPSQLSFGFIHGRTPCTLFTLSHCN